MHTAMLLLALARPMDVLEEWTLLDTAPLREVITARAVYARGEETEIAVPSVFSQGEAPSVEVVGSLAPCPVWRVGGEWHARIPRPAGGGSTVRVVARAVRPVRDARLFQLPWPIARGEASRRVALVPRGWLPGVAEGWSCADDEVSTLACVSIDTRPSPLLLRVSAIGASRGEKLLAALVALLSLAMTAAVTELASERRARLVAWGGAMIACSGVALSVVGARWTSWAMGATVASVLAGVTAALASRNERAKRVGAVGLLVLPLIAAFDGRVERVAAAVLAMVAVLVAVGWKREAPPSTVAT